MKKAVQVFPKGRFKSRSTFNVQGSMCLTGRSQRQPQQHRELWRQDLR